MPRAGSGWHYNLVHDLMRTTGCADAADIRRRFHLERVLTEVNCNIGVLSVRRLGLVAVPALAGNTFVIKAHSAPTVVSRAAVAVALLRISYIYRDPRDAMLSAFDFGRRAVEKGHPNAFSHLTTFDQAVEFMMFYVRIWEKWLREPNVLVSRYEDLLEDFEVEADRLAGYFGLNVHEPAVQEVIARYRPGESEGRQGTHFFKGRIGRFREAFSHEQQAILATRMGPALERMGYAI
jgi:hypothetical protein